MTKKLNCSLFKKFRFVKEERKNKIVEAKQEN